MLVLNLKLKKTKFWLVKGVWTIASLLFYDLPMCITITNSCFITYQRVLPFYDLPMCITITIFFIYVCASSTSINHLFITTIGWILEYQFLSAIRTWTNIPQSTNRSVNTVFWLLNIYSRNPASYQLFRDTTPTIIRRKVKKSSAENCATGRRPSSAEIVL